MVIDQSQTSGYGSIASESTPARELSITLFIDNSGSMSEEGRFASRVDFQKRLVSELCRFAQASSSRVLIRSMLFSDSPRWQQQSAVLVNQFEVDEGPVGVFSNFGAALKLALAEPAEPTAGGRQVWIWMGDGFVTDEWFAQAEVLRTDSRFKQIERYSVFSEGSIYRTALQWFAGAKDRVVITSAADRLFHDLTIGHSPVVSAADEWDDEDF